ncbi:hypothetical protein RKE25_19290 [Dyella sp. BiH032]|uniref:hypothetical protein n=1 Tax=Dyella sp. BiH032 TaxID=3075430 RepID=UPI0028929F70|nr:hypothetical protein [Dyella sp. BiH032]WNL45533.1 hypothetical protein RKE25_19290 [Dyella sp. BiH032]
MRDWKRAAHIAGGLLAAGGGAFMLMRLHEQAGALDLSRISTSQWWGLATLLIVNVAMLALLAIGWRQALLGWGAEVSPRWALATYGRTQLARYVPGNIFHFAGRQLIGMSCGIPAGALIKASATELALLVTSGCLLGGLAAPLYATWAPSLVTMAAFLTIPIVASVLWRMSGKVVMQAFLAYLAYMALSALVFLGILFLHAPPGSIHGEWIALGGAYVVGWLVGVVTPGAPAGLGVREMVLLVLLRGQVDGDLLLFSVLMTRVLAVLADVFCFVLAAVMRPNAERGGRA